MKDLDINKKNNEFLISQTKETIDWGVSYFKDRTFMTSAFGSNGVVLLDIIKEILPNIKIYFIDTSYHFEETLDIMNHYKKLGFNIEEIRSDIIDKDKNVLDMGSDICCNLNKVEPMRKLLSKKKGSLWITGLSRDQSETRSGVDFLESLDNNVYKLNPLIAWKETDIWFYIAKNSVKYNSLYDKGYRSIGCEPCTTPVKPGEESRAGRWRGIDKVECGLHDKKSS